MSALAVALALFFEPSTVHACGGFFCNQSAPVNQAAERIIFARGEDGNVTAIIQIQYSGPSERFAWLLPVTGTPEIGVSSNSAFTTLQTQTNPSYVLNTTVEGRCREGGFGPVFAAGAGRADAARRDAGGGASVVDRGSVGPYDYVVLATDPDSTDRVRDTLTWLTDNEYDVSSASGQLLRPYLDSGMNLLAFRLTKGNSTGSIRPVRITFGNGLPSIPIRPTAVAANADMGVMVFVFGAARAVPANYLSLELNEAMINWLNPGTTYNDVVTLAANEAGGQGFVTEFARSTRIGTTGPTYGELVYPAATQQSFERIERGNWAEFEGQLLQDSISAFSGFDGLRDAILESLPPPAGVDLEAFLACPACYIDAGVRDIVGFDPAGFIASLRRHVIEPLVETRAVIDQHRFMTRLYTTMSADEMTMDPVFDFNADLPPVSNIHNAERVIECSPSVSFNDAPWRVTLADATVVRGMGASWPFAAGTMPANARTLRLGTSGSGDVVEDNRASIDATIGAHNRTIPGPQRVSGGGASCAISWGGSDAAFAVVVLLLWARRRR